ncbi:tetratricopeptide repeat protein [Spirosoma rhododendri]|uniref:Tetratricopeptide repeat protein n=1 Tax=Spirosoma rhododendri TaxID=2728024 RepID=A0A7L5DP26_9BACT|nr:tetratricopeptide repeat protein [Spirosoma rhododendri]QJD80209.1 tetratricopeptide repeat protein [Spirosoma rhododendri]
MKTYCILFSILIAFNCSAQTYYASPLGFKINFDKTWKRVPKEILQKKLNDIKQLVEYREDVQFDACYQKIGNADMDYPYILFKNIHAATDNETAIKKVQEYFTSKSTFEKTVQNMVNGKFGLELTVGKNYYDAQNKILILTYDIGISIKGNLVGMFAFYFGKKASLMTYCYSYKDEFKYDQKEFINIVYSIEDKGMVTDMSHYTQKHDIAVKYYNDGKMQSENENRQEAIRLYTKAIENYPVEDTYMKSEALYNRGLNKRYINDYKGAIADYTQAIKHRPNYFKAYNNRGYAKLLLEDYTGAIIDFTMTIKYDNYNTEFSSMALGNRGIAKVFLGQDGCLDLKKSIELGNQNAHKFYNEYCK